jgi:hypothetical protein
MDAAEKLVKCDVELATLRAQYKKIGDKITKKSKVKEQLLLEINADNLKDPQWLLLNPTLPGAHEATQELVKTLYGGEYNGPHPSGYIHDGKYGPIQKNFDFWLRNYSDDSKHDLVKRNCEHFVETFLPMLSAHTEISSRWDKKFPEMKVVAFQFRSEESGLDYLGYNPENQRWYHFTMRYGSADTQREFQTFAEAFDFAYTLANTESDLD